MNTTKDTPTPDLSACRALVEAMDALADDCSITGYNAYHEAKAEAVEACIAYVRSLPAPQPAEAAWELATEMKTEPGTWSGFQSQIENRTLWVGTDKHGNVIIKATNPNNAQPVQRIAFTNEGGEHLLLLLHCALGWDAAPPPARSEDRG
jgi:hypothetical protein